MARRLAAVLTLVLALLTAAPGATDCEAPCTGCLPVITVTPWGTFLHYECTSTGTNAAYCNCIAWSTSCDNWGSCNRGGLGPPVEDPTP